jgi:hypothetical protein
MRFSIAALSILLLSGFFGSSALAQAVKKWVDEEGVTHYSDQKPVSGGGEVKQVEIPEAGVTITESKSMTERLRKQAQQLEQERKAREQAAQEKEEARAIEEALEREKLIPVPKKEKKNRPGNLGGIPYPKPSPTQ